MRQLAVIAILAALTGCLCVEASTAQTTRPLTVWIDSVRLNVCGPKTFQTAVRAASFGPGDTVIGFRPSDNVASATLYVSWDPATLQLDNLVISSGTMSNGIDITSRIFPEESTLEIVIADRQAPYGTLRGALPIVYINGTVRATDTVVPQNGWLQVRDVELTSDTQFEPEIYRPGFVRVDRDTSLKGALRVGTGAFDTLKFDTVAISLQNISQRRVHEIDFSIAADTSFFVFHDTLHAGTLAASPLWTTVILDRTADTIRGRFVAASDLSQEGPLLKIVLQRTTDSAFSSAVNVTAVGINGNSCLGGGILSFGAPVTASTIVISPPVAVPVQLEPSTDISIVTGQDGRTVLIRSRAISIDEVVVFDVLGRRIPELRRDGSADETRLELDAQTAGPYYVQLRIGTERISKQFIFIK